MEDRRRWPERGEHASSQTRTRLGERRGEHRTISDSLVTPKNSTIHSRPLDRTSSIRQLPAEGSLPLGAPASSRNTRTPPATADAGFRRRIVTGSNDPSTGHAQPRRGCDLHARTTRPTGSGGANCGLLPGERRAFSEICPSASRILGTWRPANRVRGVTNEAPLISDTSFIVNGSVALNARNHPKWS
jgi:hypothetical protein